MKIVYHHSAKWLSNSPSVSFITYTALGIAQAGQESHLVVWNNSNEDTSDILKKEFHLNEIPKNLIVHRVDANNKRSYYKKSYKLISELQNIDLVISRALTFLPYLVKLKEYVKKVMFETHDYYSELLIRKDIVRYKKIKQWLYESMYFERLDGIIALQSEQKKLISKQYSIPIHVIKTGLLRKRKINDVDVTDRNFFAYIGSFDIHKGIFDFLESVKDLHFIPIKLIGGKNEAEINMMRQKVKEICPKHVVQITGWLNKEELKRELENVKYGLIPLKETYFNSYLTSPLKLFDYYSELIPTLVSELPSVEDLVINNKTGFKIQWDKDLIRKLNSIQDESYMKLVSNIDEFNQTLTWEERGRSISRLID